MIIRNSLAQVHVIPCVIDNTKLAATGRLTGAQRKAVFREQAQVMLTSRLSASTGEGLQHALFGGGLLCTTFFSIPQKTILGVVDESVAAIGSRTLNILTPSRSIGVTEPELREGTVIIPPVCSILSSYLSREVALRVRNSPSATASARRAAERALDNFASVERQLEDLDGALLTYPEDYVMKTGDDIYYSEVAKPAVTVFTGPLSTVAYSAVPGTGTSAPRTLLTAQKRLAADFIGRVVAGVTVNPAFITARLSAGKAQLWGNETDPVLKINDTRSATVTVGSGLRKMLDEWPSLFGVLGPRLFEMDTGRELTSARRDDFSERFLDAWRSFKSDDDADLAESRDLARFIQRVGSNSQYGLTSESSRILALLEIQRVLGNTKFTWEGHDSSDNPTQDLADQVAKLGTSPLVWDDHHERLSISNGVVRYREGGDTIDLKIGGEGENPTSLTLWTNSSSRAKLLRFVQDFKRMIGIMAWAVRSPSAASGEYPTADGTLTITVRTPVLLQMLPRQVMSSDEAFIVQDAA